MASEIAEHITASEVAEDVTASEEASYSTSEWYEHLGRGGSCLRLHDLLKEKRELIHQLGPKGITVLHKGVDHGCVLLVKFILVNIFDGEGYCTCRVCGPGDSRLTRGQLLRKACEDDITAVQMAVVSGSPKMVLLLKWAIDKNELEVKQKNFSSKVDKVSARVRIRKVHHISTGNALWFSKEKPDIEGETGSTDVGPRDAVDESRKETLPESVIDDESNNLAVPDVKDDTIDCVYDGHSEEEEIDMIPKVYDIIERLLEDLDCFEPDIQEQIQMWKDECKKHVDFEFVPVAHVFLHFLVGLVDVYYHAQFFEKRPVFIHAFEKIIRACNEHDREEQGTGAMVATLFKILDPRGRTILHVASNDGYRIFVFLQSMDKMGSNEMSIELMKKCMNTTDGAGRTILHIMSTRHVAISLIMDPRKFQKWDVKYWNWDAVLSPLCSGELSILKEWCFPHQNVDRADYRPIHLAILFDISNTFRYAYFNFEGEHARFEYRRGRDTDGWISCTSLQLAAFLGRSTIIEEILEHAKFKPYDDTCPGEYMSSPAIHCAILSGQVEALQSILKFQVYDPIIQLSQEGTALHLLLKRKNFNGRLRNLQNVAMLHMLPNSKTYACLKDRFSKLLLDEHEPTMFSAYEISCINLLLQAGIDIWTPHCGTGERPSPGPMSNDKAREWWYDKVVSEVVTQKTSINNASNATSVIATLVATASVIGPLQPPLGLADDGFLYTSASTVRVYFVCNGLSFYFSIASILMAVLPAIPMPKESLYDELFRSQRCLKTAALFLLVSIICLLASFTSASFAVISCERHDVQLVGAYVGVGGTICIFVLVVYIIRMLRMVFHKNDRFRRWFAKHMIF